VTLLQTMIRTLSGQPLNVSPESPTYPLTSATLLDWIGGPQASSGVRVTETSVLGIPAVWRAVNLVAGVSASLPLHAFKRDDVGRRIMLTSGQAADLIADPHPDMTDLELWELVYGSLMLWGNAYLRKLRSPDGVLRELWWINPSRVKTNRTPDDGRKIYVVDGEEDRPLFDQQILHIPGFGYDGVCGVAPVRAAREGFGLALAAEQYGARFFGNGSLATGILQSEQRLDLERAMEIKQLWKATGGTGLDSAHDVRVVGSGAKFDQLTIPNDDAQFLETRTFQVGEIARMFGVPPHLLMDVSGSTSWGTGIEQQTLGWVKFGLAPWLTRVERRLSKTIRPAAAYVKYALEGLLRGDSKERAEFYNKLWQIGVLSTNEIRELEDRDPVEGGDVRYRPLNMGVLGQADPAQSPADAAVAALTAAIQATETTKSREPANADA
jgi:HK97 family phage portal protein